MPRDLPLQRRQGIFWILTLSCALSDVAPTLRPNISWIRGQREIGEGGFEHWQFVLGLSSKGSIRTIQGLFPGAHAELTRSDAALSYVWKDDTAVPGTRFELGAKPICRNSKTDWDTVWNFATEGQLLSIPASIRVQNYRTLRNIASDHQIPVAVERTVHVYYGATGTGKSRRAWDEAGILAYPKDPRTKFWCGYHGQLHVVIDEFRGGIDISHLLRWLDRYPVIVEVKGSSVCLTATHIWITSNISPREWYPLVDEGTYDALARRLNVVEF